MDPDNVADLKSRVDSANFYEGDTIVAMLALNGNESYEFGQKMFGENALNGAFAGIVYQTMKSVDTTIHRKLNYY